MTAEEYTIGQSDDSDRWYVLRGDEVVAGPYYHRDTAADERDRRNLAYEVPQFEQIGRDSQDRPIYIVTNDSEG